MHEPNNLADQLRSRRQFLRDAAGLAVAGAVSTMPDVAPAAPPPVRTFRRGGMLYRQLGRSDLFVSALSFGSHTDPAFRVHQGPGISTLNPKGQALRDRHIAKALDRGVNMVDVYDRAGQWKPIAETVRSRRDRVLVSLCREFSQVIGDHVEHAARRFGHVDLYRLAINDGPVTEPTLEAWDAVQRARRMGDLRATGIASHCEEAMLSALDKLEGLDFIMFPYNFIHARADYSRFLPKAIERGIGLIAIKPLAAGSIVQLDPLAQHGSKPEDPQVRLYKRANRSLLPAVVQKLTEHLDRVPDESLCQAALRFVYARPFITSAMPGMFQEHEVDDNIAAIQRHLVLTPDEHAVLDHARHLCRAQGPRWLPPHYRWLDRCWRHA